MTGQTFDVWLTDFEQVGAQRAADALSATFRLERSAAMRLLVAMPCRVAMRVSQAHARAIADGLTAIGGHAVVTPSGEAHASLTRSTLRLGTFDASEVEEARALTSPAPTAYVVGPLAIEPVAPLAVSAPAVLAHVPSLDLAGPQHVPSPLQPARQFSPASFSPASFEPAPFEPAPFSPASFSPAPSVRGAEPLFVAEPLAASVDLDGAPRPVPSRRAPEPPLVMRDPKQRARPARARPRSTRDPAPAPGPSVLDPLKLTASVWKDAERTSWRQALRGHPVLGFLLVLTATTAVFLALYVLIRSANAPPDEARLRLGRQALERGVADAADAPAIEHVGA